MTGKSNASAWVPCNAGKPWIFARATRSPISLGGLDHSEAGWCCVAQHRTTRIEGAGGRRLSSAQLLATDAGLRKPVSRAPVLAQWQAGPVLAQVGPGTWEKLLATGRLNNLLDWLTLDAQELANIDGFGERSAARLVDSFNSARQRPFVRWLKALGLPPTGQANLAGSWQELARTRHRAMAGRGRDRPGTRGAIERIFPRPAGAGPE